MTAVTVSVKDKLTLSLGVAVGSSIVRVVPRTPFLAPLIFLILAVMTNSLTDSIFGYCSHTANRPFCHPVYRHPRLDHWQASQLVIRPFRVHRALFGWYVVLPMYMSTCSDRLLCSQSSWSTIPYRTGRGEAAIHHDVYAPYGGPLPRLCRTHLCAVAPLLREHVADACFVHSNWLEGMILMCLYVILAVVFWYYPGAYSALASSRTVCSPVLAAS